MSGKPCPPRGVSVIVRTRPLLVITLLYVGVVQAGEEGQEKHAIYTFHDGKITGLPAVNGP